MRRSCRGKPIVRKVRGVRITGIGKYLPQKVLTNAELEQMVETSDEWITTRTGIKERRISGPEESSSVLALHAAREALAKAGRGAEEVELIIVATVTPDMPFPSTACLLQAALGARRAAAFDLAAACAGFIYACATGAQFIASGFCDLALVVGVDTLSKIVNWRDRNTCVLFGDGAGAVVLEPAPEGKGFLSFVLGADGTGSDYLKVPAGGSLLPASAATVAGNLHTISMNGSEVFKFAVRAMPEAALQSLEKAGVSIGEVDLFIPHQANLRIIEAVRKRLGLEAEKVFVNLAKYGNTSAASLPVALAEAAAEGRLKDGSIVVLAAFGAGFTWAACTLRW